MQQSGCALIPALRVHVCPGLAALSPPVQPVDVLNILCTFPCIMAQAENLARYRVRQLAYCSTRGPVGRAFTKPCYLRALSACLVSSLSIRSSEAAKLQPIGHKAACN